MSLIIRRTPVRDMLAMQNNMDRLLDEMWRGFGQNLPATAGNALPLEVHENDTSYTVTTDLPGVREDHVEVSYHDGALTINAEFQQTPVSEGSKAVLRERAYGRYTRTLTLPQPVNPDAIEATFDNGVLTLTLPKAEHAQPRRIAVKRSPSLVSGTEGGNN